MKKIFSKILSSVLVVVAMTSTAPASADDFVVVHNRSVELPSTSPEALRKIFTGRTKQWSSGSAVQVALIAGESPETAFLARIVGVDRVSDLLASIQQQVFRGEMRRPVVIRSSEQCVSAARSNPGLVCIARAGLPLPAEVVAEQRQP